MNAALKVMQGPFGTVVDAWCEVKARKHGAATSRGARCRSNRRPGAGLGVMPDGGETKALGTDFRRDGVLPGDTLIEFGLGLSEEVPVRRRLGRLV